MTPEITALGVEVEEHIAARDWAAALEAEARRQALIASCLSDVGSTRRTREAIDEIRALMAQTDRLMQRIRGAREVLMNEAGQKAQAGRQARRYLEIAADPDTSR